MQDEGRRFRPLQTSNLLQSPVPSINLPPSLFGQIQQQPDVTTISQLSDDIGVVFAFYEMSTLFPVGEYISNGTKNSSRIATEIIAAHVARESIDGLPDPVTVTLKRKEVC